MLKLLLVAFLAIWLTASGAIAQQPAKIRIAWVVPVADSPSILYETPATLHHRGKTYEVELTRFQGTPAMITALATKSTTQNRRALVAVPMVEPVAFPDA